MDRDEGISKLRELRQRIVERGASTWRDTVDLIDILSEGETVPETPATPAPPTISNDTPQADNNGTTATDDSENQ